MKKSLLTMALLASLAASAQVYQLPNSDFESDFVLAYHADKTFISSEKNFYEPLGWHGYATIDGTVGAMGRSGEKLNASTDVRPGSEGKQSAVLSTTSVFGIKANGVMTTGRIYANSTTATDGNNNYNYSEPGYTDTSNSNANSSFSQPFHGHPDAMRAWVKFDAAAATQSSDYPYASCNVVITNNGRYQDPEGSTDYSAVRVARACNTEIAGYGEWQQLVMPFDYAFGESDDAQYILVTFTTNAQPGGGTAGDKLYVDDIEMVYNSELASLSVYDQEIFVEGQTAYDLSSVDYSADALALSANGYAATIETDYDEATALLTITVKGEDYALTSNAHTYTVQFRQGESEGVRNYLEPLVITVNGETGDPQPAAVTLIKNDDDTCDFTLRNFILWAGGEPMPVGNISVSGVSAVENEPGILTLSTEQVISLQPGDLPGVDFWMASMLPPVPVVLNGFATDSHLYCLLTIDMATTLGQSIVVTLGDKDNIPTGISTLDSAAATTVYDTAGRTVSHMQPGRIYIVRTPDGRTRKALAK